MTSLSLHLFQESQKTFPLSTYRIHRHFMDPISNSIATPSAVLPVQQAVSSPESARGPLPSSLIDRPAVTSYHNRGPVGYILESVRSDEPDVFQAISHGDEA